MEDRNVQSRLDAIEVQAIRLARWLKLAIYGWLLTVFVLLLSTCTRGTRAAQESNAQKDVLRVHQLVVVDEKGIDRILSVKNRLDEVKFRCFPVKRTLRRQECSPRRSGGERDRKSTRLNSSH